MIESSVVQRIFQQMVTPKPHWNRPVTWSEGGGTWCHGRRRCYRSSSPRGQDSGCTGCVALVLEDSEVGCEYVQCDGVVPATLVLCEGEELGVEPARRRSHIKALEDLTHADHVVDAMVGADAHAEILDGERGGILGEGWDGGLG